MANRPDLVIRSLHEDELAVADSIYRRSFGTFVGLPDAESFGADSDLIGSRWRADPARVLAAVDHGSLVGTCIATNWGSFGFFGPLTVSPERWDQGIGKALMGAVMQHFAAWHIGHLGLFTFPHSTKHLHLYERFGFHARFLTSMMSKTPEPRANTDARWSDFAALTADERGTALQDCRAVADAVFEGLDLTGEIEAVHAQRAGDTVLLLDGDRTSGFAVCHCGAGTEATGGECYVKFGAVRPGSGAGSRFAHLLDACEAFAAARGLGRVSAGVNLGCDAAYDEMRRRGFRMDYTGVAMQQPNGPGYNRSDRHVISDWR